MKYSGLDLLHFNMNEQEIEVAVKVYKRYFLNSEEELKDFFSKTIFLKSFDEDHKYDSVDSYKQAMSGKDLKEEKYLEDATHLYDICHDMDLVFSREQFVEYFLTMDRKKRLFDDISHKVTEQDIEDFQDRKKSAYNSLIFIENEQDKIENYRPLSSDEVEEYKSADRYYNDCDEKEAQVRDLYEAGFEAKTIEAFLFGYTKKQKSEANRDDR